MFKIVACKNAQARVDYFLKDKELDENERTGHWLGNGATVLGLNPKPSKENPNPSPKIVTEVALKNILLGYAPPDTPLNVAWKLNGRYYENGKRRCAFDCVLSPDKSISIAGLCLPDQEYERTMAVRTAWVKAVDNTLTFMESLARRGAGKKLDVTTGSLLAARFLHNVSRRNDPHMHAHLLVANATHDGRGKSSRNGWYALEPIGLYKHIREIDLVLQRELHRHLRAAGLNATMKTVDNVQVTSLPIEAAICARLSKAHKAILTATALRWNRDERSLPDRRTENLLNDRCRPSKAGSLAAREEMFERALSPTEIKEIVRGMGQPLSLDQLRLVIPPKAPVEKDMDRLIFDASRLLQLASANRVQLAQTALLAANSHRNLPFQPFYNHTRDRLDLVRNIANNPGFFVQAQKAQDVFMHEQEDWFDLRHSAKFMFAKRKPGDQPPEATSLLPIASEEPEPLAQAPEPQRATWVNDALEERRLLREKIERDRKAAERAAEEEKERGRALAQEEVARPIGIGTLRTPPASPPSSTATPSHPSRPEDVEELLSADLQTRPRGRPRSVDPPPTASSPEPMPRLEGATRQPLSPDQSGQDARPYLPTPQEPESARLQ